MYTLEIPFNLIKDRDVENNNNIRLYPNDC